MIHIIDSANKNLYKGYMKTYYQLRHEIYVRERGWTDLEHFDGLEIDQFDTEDAIYLLFILEGKIVGGSRLFPTMKPHLLSECFPYLVDLSKIQRSPDILEWTRVFIIRECRGSSSYMLNSLLAALMDYCLWKKVARLSVVMETWWLPIFKRIGWQVAMLGRPCEVQGMTCVATTIKVSNDSLEGILRQIGKSSASWVYRSEQNIFDAQHSYQSRMQLAQIRGGSNTHVNQGEYVNDTLG